MRRDPRPRPAGTGDRGRVRDRHLGELGEIRITRLDPETAVAWEGERARGTVRIEPAGWGTRVTLTAVPATVQPGKANAAAVAKIKRIIRMWALLELRLSAHMPRRTIGLG